MVLLFCNGYAFVVYRLEKLVNTIVADGGGAVSPLFEFTYKGEFCTLEWTYDIKPLTYRYGEVSNHRMEWIRTWLNPQLEDVKCHLYSLYLIPILDGFLRMYPTESLEVFIEFVHEKYPNFLELDITTLLVPYTCGKHWTLYILWDEGFVHFGSISNVGLHSDSKIRKRLAKMWTAWGGYAEQSVMWRNAQSPTVWIQPTILQQNFG